MKTNTRLFGRWVWRSLLAGMFTLLCSAGLGAAPTVDLDTQVEFDIPAQPLPSAVVLFSRQAGVQVLTATKDLEGINASAVKGKLSLREAVRRLLEGTGLVAVHGGPNAIAIRPAVTTPQRGEGAVSDSMVAQTQSTESTEVKKQLPIVVTGTNIRGNTSVASPIQVIDKVEIQRRGYVSVPDLLASLPQNFALINAWRQSAGDVEQAGNIGRATGVNLRGLGPRATLVLINGRRVAPTGIGSFVDVSAIPISAIERVEILGDGASAIYGTDAVAGVINFVLKKPADEAETTLKWGKTSSGAFEEGNASQAVGRTWEGGGFMLAVDYLRNTDLGKDERDFSRSAPSPAPLIPYSKQYSVVGNVRQDAGRQLTLFSDFIYASRKTSNFDSGVFQDVDKDSYAVTIGGLYDLTRNWILEVSASSSRDTVKRDTVVTSIGLVIPTSQTTRATFANIKLNGSMFSVPGGEVRAAVGGEYVGLALNYKLSTFLLADDSSNHNSLFAEMLVPLIGPSNGTAFAKSFSLTAAVRRDDYSTFGAVSNPKVGAVWELNDSLKARATWGTAFRTPTLNDIAPGGTASFVTNLPDPSSPTGTSRTLILTGSNPSGLKPEDSTSWTAGFDLRPAALQGFSASANYFKYDYTDRIDRAATSGNVILASPATYSRFLIVNPTVDQINAFYAQSFSVGAAAGLTTTPSLITRVTDLRVNNVSATKLRGVEADMRYAWACMTAKCIAGVGGTYFINFRNTPVPGGDSVPGSGISLTPANFKGRASVGYQGARVTADVAVNYVAAYTDVFPGQPDRRVEAWTPIDLRIAYRPAHRLWFGGMAEFALYVRNLFDEPPPFVRDLSTGGPRGFDATNADPLGRMIFLEFRYAW